MSKTENTTQQEFVFGKMNYMIMLVGIIFMVLGYFVMAGGGSTDFTVFNEAELYSPMRITVAPILIIIGILIQIPAIVYKAK